MAFARNIINDWLPASAAVGVVLLTSIYAGTKYSEAATVIQEARRLGDGLCAASERAQADILDPSTAKAAKLENEDLHKRMEEANRPAIVQAELMAAAHQAGLTVEEVLPIPASNSSGDKSGLKYPCYRLLVQGAFSQIAEFMEICKTQRVPMRTISFRITSALDKQGRPGSALKADIAVESFISQFSSAEGGRP